MSYKQENHAESIFYLSSSGLRWSAQFKTVWWKTKTICQVVLAKTNQKMIVNLLMMVLIDLHIIKFTCQHHVSGYVCRVWQWVFFLLLIEIISIAKFFIIVHFFVLKHEKQTLSYIHTKFEGDKNNSFFFL